VSGLLCLCLAAAVVIATATGIAGVAATSTAEEDEDKDDYPRTIISTKVTHLRKPPFLFSSHTMIKEGDVLQIKSKLFVG